MNIFEMLETSILVRNHVKLCDGVCLRIDRLTYNKGFLITLRDKKTNPISNIIRGFKNVDALNKWLETSFSAKYNIKDKKLYYNFNGTPVPRFKEAFVRIYEDREF